MATLADWIIEATDMYFKPIYEELYRQIFSSDIIHADETVVQVLKEEDRKAYTML